MQLISADAIRHQRDMDWLATWPNIRDRLPYVRQLATVDQLGSVGAVWSESTTPVCNCRSQTFGLRIVLFYDANPSFQFVHLITCIYEVIHLPGSWSVVAACPSATREQVDSRKRRVHNSASIRLERNLDCMQIDQPEVLRE